MTSDDMRDDGMVGDGTTGDETVGDGTEGAEFAPPPSITCVDCGGTAHLITPPRPDEDAVTGYRLGDILAYRCADCLDRWDLEFD